MGSDGGKTERGYTEQPDETCGARHVGLVLSRWSAGHRTERRGKVLLTATIDMLAKILQRTLLAIESATAAAREPARDLTRTSAPNHSINGESPRVIDIDATLVTAYSEKESAAPT